MKVSCLIGPVHPSFRTTCRIATRLCATREIPLACWRQVASPRLRHRWLGGSRRNSWHVWPSLPTCGIACRNYRRSSVLSCDVYAYDGTNWTCDAEIFRRYCKRSWLRLTLVWSVCCRNAMETGLCFILWRHRRFCLLLCQYVIMVTNRFDGLDGVAS